MRVLSAADVEAALDLDALLAVIEEAFRRQGRGEVVRPERPHFPVGAGRDGGDPAGTGLVMPAYVRGADRYAVKLASVHEGNAARGLPTVNAQIALTDAATGLPAAFVAGDQITDARTGCIGGLAARELAVETPVRLGVIGAGRQARWQSRAVAAAAGVERARIYSPSDSRAACAADLRAAGIDAEAVETPRAAVADASVVVTATTAAEPTFPGEALSPGALVIAVGAYAPEMRELDARTVERAATVFADVPAEAAATGDLPTLDAEELVALSAVFEGDAGRGDDADVLVVESVGSAVLDAAAAEHVFQRAVERDLGTEVEF